MVIEHLPFPCKIAPGMWTVVGWADGTEDQACVSELSPTPRLLDSLRPPVETRTLAPCSITSSALDETSCPPRPGCLPGPACHKDTLGQPRVGMTHR